MREQPKGAFDLFNKLELKMTLPSSNELQTIQQLKYRRVYLVVPPFHHNISTF